MISDVTTTLSSWNYPTAMLTGADACANLGDCCQKLGIHKPLVVTDKTLATTPVVDRVVACLKEAGIVFEVNATLSGEPYAEDVAALRQHYNQGFDGIVALGGGSVLDCAKAVALLADERHRLWDFIDGDMSHADLATVTVTKMIAIPTTAGTGSELGRVSVIVDGEAKTKRFLFHPNLVPDQVIYDPTLTVGLPKFVTATTGCDALAHALEAYCVPSYHPIADGIALQAMRLVNENLHMAVSEPNNLVARQNMLVASGMGACAFQKGLGGVHAISHVLGANFGLAHGLLNSVLLPYVLAFNLPVLEDKMVFLARNLELTELSGAAVVEWLRSLHAQLGLPMTLRDAGLGEDAVAKLDALYPAMLADPSAAGNPVPLNELALSEILAKALG